MDDLVRDLERIRENGAAAAWPRALSVLGGAAVVGLILAVAVVMSRAAAPKAGGTDPLAMLPPLLPQAAQEPPQAGSHPALRIDVSDLSFPKVLADAEDRPEVLASLKAAAEEEAALAEAARGEGATASSRVRIDPARRAEALSPQAMVARVPAALAATSAAGRGLRRSNAQDPLLTAAMGAHPPKSAAAAEGRPGPYTLHVISYDRVEIARAFATGLRARGHAAFIVPADVPERGRTFRVRIGPFQTREQAELYRRKFDDQERMNTLVLRETHAAE